MGFIGIDNNIKSSDSCCPFDYATLNDIDPEIGSTRKQEKSPLQFLPCRTFMVLIDFYRNCNQRAFCFFAAATPNPTVALLAIATIGLMVGTSKGQLNKSIGGTFDRPLEINLNLKNNSAFRDPLGHVEWSISLSHSSINPGESVELLLSAVPDKDYHIYAAKILDKETNFRTVLVLTEKGQLKASEPVPSSPSTMIELIPGESMEIHDGTVTWKVLLQSSVDIPEGITAIEGFVGYQACSDKNCDVPLGLKFRGEIEIANTKLGKAIAMAIVEANFSDIKQHPLRNSWVDSIPLPTPTAALSLAEIISYLSLALLGGFILNFMPCVLPVIGLKVLGFVQESDGNACRTRQLNLWYVVGLMSIIMGFGVAIVLARSLLGVSILWGEQFGNFGFRLTMSILVLAMALSFLGVWEIPIPGFASSQKSGEWMAREGITGAFSKGAITTVLATPCSGPFLGSIFGLTLTQPSWIVLLLFFGIGIGFSSPFIMIAIWPSMIRCLPKPGSWMDILKQALAFPLLMTTVYFVATFANEYRIAVLSILVCVGFSCWMIGRLPSWSEFSLKLGVWSSSLAIGGLVSWACFSWLGPTKKLIPWESYSEERLVALSREGKTVMIDFTAKWCWNCMTNSRIAIETERVAELVKKNGVVPMIADWSDYSVSVKMKLQELNSASIPLLAIYPASRPKQPIILRDIISESTLVEALEVAGPSHARSVAVSSVSQLDRE